MAKKILLTLVAFIGIATTTFFIGPKPTFGPSNFKPIAAKQQEITLENLDSLVAAKEATIKDIKPDNAAKIIWQDSLHKKKTPFSVVYLHGFSASSFEGSPIHTDFAKEYGMNLYLSRLEDHGRIDSNSFQQLTPELLIKSAKEAIEIGKLLGDSVIVMSCSTGGTLAAILAGEEPRIHSLICYSPNIDLADPKSELIMGHWGKQIMSVVMGGEHHHIVYPENAQQYWNSIYHINGIIAVKSLIEQYMNPVTFAKIKQPVFLGYYYKDEEHQDNVVSVPRMLDFYNEISTPKEKKWKIAFADANAHVICNGIFSKEIDLVKSQTFQFGREVLGLVPVEKPETPLKTNKKRK